MDVQTYYANPFTAISNHRNMTEFFVMDLDEEGGQQRGNPAAGPAGDRWKPVGAWVVPSAHLGADGEDGEAVFVRSHLGNILKIGDNVMG